MASFLFFSGGVSNSFSDGFRSNTFNYVVNGEEKSFDFKTVGSLERRIESLPREIFTTRDNVKNITEKIFIENFLSDDEQKSELRPFFQILQNKTKNDEDTAKAIISTVQDIPYDFETKGKKIKLPYQVLHQNKGDCDEKTNLSILLLREMNYGVGVFNFENHSMLALKCPKKISYEDSGYCAVEMTKRSIFGYMPKSSVYKNPKLIVIADGKEIKNVSLEISDSREYENLQRIGIANRGKLSKDDFFEYKSILNKYGMNNGG